MTEKIVTQCKADECMDAVKGKGYCGKHYARWKRTGGTTLRSRECHAIGCEKTRGANVEYCQSHLRRFRLYGDPLVYGQGRAVGDTQDLRFWSRVNLTADDSRCWDWQGAKDNRGYGRVTVKYFVWLTHRYAWLLVKGEDANGLLLHSCDNPSCVNPNHLRIGDMQDNVNDAIDRDRMPWGEKHYRANCTNDQVRAIRQRCGSGESRKTVAQEMNLPYSTVSSVASGRGYKHVSDICQ